MEPDILWTDMEALIVMYFTLENVRAAQPSSESDHLQQQTLKHFVRRWDAFRQAMYDA